MAKFYGVIGFGTTEESKTKPGVWETTIEERAYPGDVLSDGRQFQQGVSANDNLTMNTRISIMPDIFALQNFHKVKYIFYMGVKWKVSSVSSPDRRLVFSLGEVYNA